MERMFDKKEFIPTEKLFPAWITAPVMLEYFCNNTSGIVITRDVDDPDGINIMIDSFSLNPPPEEISKTRDILRGLLNDYLPENIEKYLWKPMADITIREISIDFADRENYILSHGGRKFIDELRYRLGIMIKTGKTHGT